MQSAQCYNASAAQVLKSSASADRSFLLLFSATPRLYVEKSYSGRRGTHTNISNTAAP